MMEKYTKNLKILQDALEEITSGLEVSYTFTESLDLVGKNGILDSLSLVSFISTLEEILSDEYNKEIKLTTDSAFSRTRSPFATVKSLADFITEITE